MTAEFSVRVHIRVLYDPDGQLGDHAGVSSEIQIAQGIELTSPKERLSLV